MAKEIYREIDSFKEKIDLKILDRVIELIYSSNNVCIFGTQYSL